MAHGVATCPSLRHATPRRPVSLDGDRAAERLLVVAFHIVDPREQPFGIEHDLLLEGPAEVAQPPDGRVPTGR